MFLRSNLLNMQPPILDSVYEWRTRPGALVSTRGPSSPTLKAFPLPQGVVSVSIRRGDAMKDGRAVHPLELYFNATRDAVS